MQEWFYIHELVQTAGDELFTFKCLGLCPERRKTLKFISACNSARQGQ